LPNDLQEFRIAVGVTLAAMARETGFTEHSLAGVERSVKPRRATKDYYIKAVMSLARKQLADERREMVRDMLVAAGAAQLPLPDLSAISA
jgi:hypothetical protein